PMAGPPIIDGGVLWADGRIVAVGPFAGLRVEGGRVVEHEGCALIPALVNAHAHLELSHLAPLGREAAVTPFPGMAEWITALLHRRETVPASDEEIAAQARAALDDLRRTGTILVADTGNRPESVHLGRDGGMDALFFLEFLGLSRAAAEAGLKRLAAVEAGTACTAHAPYSTAPGLIRGLKQRAAAAGRLFPIHVAESADEIEFLRTGGGPLRRFLESRGAWDGSFAPPGCGAVDDLHRLGVLDGRTLCVHAVHLSSGEIDTLASRQAKVCLCPGSNRTLGVGKAPVAKLLAAGIRPALGTDSLASNPRLDLWEEMRLLREDHPEVAPEEVFAMATANGAAALGCAGRLGSLAPGRDARLLAVRCPVPPDDIFEFLTTAGPEAEVRWVE
ncbi:MAG: amidohydrolase family protein, partial [Desulfobacteraceae bacterium]|nr:amidohydrolase family protein [Desulfobacteraceae bacterium]